MTVDEYTEASPVITMPLKRWQEIVKCLQWLEALEEAGVDNWSGIDYAYELFENRERDEESR